MQAVNMRVLVTLKKPVVVTAVDITWAKGNFFCSEENTSLLAGDLSRCVDR